MQLVLVAKMAVPRAQSASSGVELSATFAATVEVVTASAFRICCSYQQSQKANTYTTPVKGCVERF
jgi:hypothetical protein